MKLVAAGVLLAALALAGCADSGSLRYGRSDLPGLVLRPSEAPKETKYEASASGASMIERARHQGDSPLRALRPFGFQADYGSVFFPKGVTPPLAFADSTAVLFRNETGAEKALVFVEGMVAKTPGAEEVSALGLGEQSWAFTGSFGTAYCWRRRNVLLCLDLGGSTPAAVKQVAERLDERAARKLQR